MLLEQRCCSVAKPCLTLCHLVDWSTPGSSILLYHPKFDKFMSLELVMLSKHFVLYSLLLLLSSTFPFIRVFSSESVLCIRWPNYWSFSFSISPSDEYSGLIFFRIDWFDLLVVQVTLKSLLQHHISKVSIIQHSFLYGSTLTSIHAHWKTTTTTTTIALTTQTLSAK